MADAIRVDGLAELQRAFTAADRALREDLRDALQEAAAPVRRDAQTLAGTTISHMTTNRATDWSRMRIGMAGGSVVYVAPVERGGRARANQRLRRRRFKGILGSRMDMALERNRAAVLRRMDGLLDDVIKVWDRHGR